MEKNPNFIKLNGQRIKISKPVKPENVYWKNLKRVDDGHRKRIINSIIIMVMTVFIVFGLHLVLDFVKRLRIV